MHSKFKLPIFANEQIKNTIMKNFKILLITLALTSITFKGFADNLFTQYYNDLCVIYVTNFFHNPNDYNKIKRVPAKDAQVKVGDNIYVSFTSELSDVSVAVLFNGAEIHNESYANVVSGDVFSYPITEIGEYTVIVSVNGETVAEGTVNVEL